MPEATAASERRVALVTGGGRGVGAAVVRGLAARGCAVAIHCHASLAEARALAAEIEAAGGEALAVTANLREEGAVRAMMHRVADRFGRLDLVVATARMRRPGRLEDLAGSDLVGHFETTVVGTFVVAQEAAAVMERQASGGLVIALADDSQPEPEAIAFAASQAAIPGLMRGLAAAFAPRHDRLEARCLLSAALPATPEEVAAAVLAIAAERLMPRPAAGS
jgi:NAD(P)-dependent dehydrogenase (short-subunit alcohol dehydrogenase family)